MASAAAPPIALFGVLLCLPMAPVPPIRGNGDFGASAFLWQLSDKPLLACNLTGGAPPGK